MYQLQVQVCSSYRVRFIFCCHVRFLVKHEVTALSGYKSNLFTVVLWCGPPPPAPLMFYFLPHRPLIILLVLFSSSLSSLFCSSSYLSSPSSLLFCSLSSTSLLSCSSRYLSSSFSFFSSFSSLLPCLHCSFPLGTCPRYSPHFPLLPPCSHPSPSPFSPLPSTTCPFRPPPSPFCSLSSSSSLSSSF